MEGVEPMEISNPFSGSASGIPAARSLADQHNSFAYAARGMMATTGHLKGVAQLGRLPLTGLPAWLLWRGYYLLRMPTFGRKLRIWVEWTWGLFFPLDITHLRFTRTAEAERSPVPSPLSPRS